jgi:hypothetical protein
MTNTSGIEEIDPDEQKLCQIRKHPFGLFSVYAEIIIGFLAVLVVIYFFLPTMLPNASKSEINGFIAAGGLVFAVIAWVGLTAFTFIYRGSYLIVTDRNVTQVLQQGLFNRKVSELSLGNVEDVNAQRQGFFATIFNFGKLNVETAGEAENFVFQFCPKPNYYGKVILDARRAFTEKVTPAAVPAPVAPVQQPYSAPAMAPTEQPYAAPAPVQAPYEAPVAPPEQPPTPPEYPTPTA